MAEAGRRARVASDEGGGRVLKIGEVSRRSGVGVEALRFYERGGLIDRPSRTRGGYRVYGEGVLERLAFIRRAQALGFSLDEIRRIVDDARRGASPCDEVREIVRRRMAELDERLRELQRYRKELKATLDEWDRVGRAPGHVCGLIEGSAVGRGGRAARRPAEGLKKSCRAASAGEGGRG